MDGSVVGDGARLRASALGRGARVGAGTVLDGTVLGDDAAVGAGNELLTDVRVFAGARIGDRALRFSTDEA